MSNDKEDLLTWAEIDKQAAIHNIKTLRKIVGPKVNLSVCVKANAYGHGLNVFSKITLDAGAEWLNVNALFEAESLRENGIKSPIYIMGYVLKQDLAKVVELDCRLVVYNKETVKELSAAAHKLGKKARIHLKIETGNNRQGIFPENALDFAKYAKSFPEIEVEGIATHFANIEDINASGKFKNYPHMQLEIFNKVIGELEENGINIPFKHCANSAATLMFPQTYFNMVRPGIAIYGLWPSEEVKKAAHEQNAAVSLKPVLSWKTRIAQIKEIPANSYIGYGCTYKTKQKTKLAILPVGYYDGYDRGLSNKADVLICGKRAPLRGRVCMNIVMVDVTEIPGARVEGTATLLGSDGKENISAEELGEMAQTINYDITTRIHEGIPRIVVF